MVQFYADHCQQLIHAIDQRPGFKGGIDENSRNLAHLFLDEIVVKK